MKKLQNYMFKPEEIRKKLEQSKIKHNFLDWNKNKAVNKNNQSYSRPSRSKSPS